MLCVCLIELCKVVFVLVIQCQEGLLENVKSTLTALTVHVVPIKNSNIAFRARVK